jgi:hypothetical protein
MNCPNCGGEYQVVFRGQAAAAKTKRVSTMSDERKAVGIPSGRILSVVS